MIQIVGIGQIIGIPILVVKIIIVSIACQILNPSILGVPCSKMNSGFAQSGQIFLIFQSSNYFHLLKVSPSLVKIVSNDQMIWILLESAQLFWLFWPFWFILENSFEKYSFYKRLSSVDFELWKIRKHKIVKICNLIGLGLFDFK